MSTIGKVHLNQVPSLPIIDFIWRTVIIERVTVCDKDRPGKNVWVVQYYPIISKSLEYLGKSFISVETRLGTMRIQVSHEVWELIQRGDEIVVGYRQGRFTKSLKGNLLQGEYLITQIICITSSPVNITVYFPASPSTSVALGFFVNQIIYFFNFTH